MIANQLIKELDTVLSGIPWHGNSVITLLRQTDPANSHKKQCGPHSPADILLHMIAWTEETDARLKGKFAADPDRGDWPDPADFSWDDLMNLFISANEHLKLTIVSMNEDKFNAIVNDNREPDQAELITYKELIRGIVHHQVYHSAQIAMLNK